MTEYQLRFDLFDYFSTEDLLSMVADYENELDQMKRDWCQENLGYIPKFFREADGSSEIWILSFANESDAMFFALKMRRAKKFDSR